MIDIWVIINEITPLYNKYKANIEISWTEALNIMRDIGNILKKHIQIYNIAPHSLYRMIYWKSEGSNHITQKSRISREFQWKAFRIRNFFNEKSDIDKYLPNLKKFRLFSQAMPFLDNEKYKLEWKDKENLLALLNSNKSYKEIFKELCLLKQEKIGIKNPRTQKLNELSEEKQIFINFYNLVYNILSKQEFNLLINEKITKEHLSLLSKNTNSLSQDWLKFNLVTLKETKNSIFNDYNSMINNFIAEKTPKKIRRFRRIITPERIVRLADILYTIYTKIQ